MFLIFHTEQMLILNVLKIILQFVNFFHFFVFLGLWTSNNEAANHLLERILPAGLLHHLHSDDPGNMLVSFRRFLAFFGHFNF